jgi:hypothetical protein
MLYTNSCGRIYHYGFELLVNNEYLFYSWQAVDTVSFYKKSKVNIYKLGLVLIVVAIAVPFNLYMYPQTDWLINAVLVAVLMGSLYNIMKQVPLISIKFKNGEYKMNQVPVQHIDVAKDFARMIKKAKDKNFIFNNIQQNELENRSINHKEIELA